MEITIVEKNEDLASAAKAVVQARSPLAWVVLFEGDRWRGGEVGGGSS